ncbi:MAG: nuclear transport factor 2 family protein [Spirochaetes bacterium]|nr:nuclear transport factor 2 family protein [Spirochaetota bacterium]
MEKRLTFDEYRNIMQRCLEAWNRADAEETASFYCEDADYRDPSIPGGVATRADFIAYLKVLFRVWPRQQWTPREIIPHEKPGSFSITYDFLFANDRVEIRGNGIDIMEFRGDRISLNHVYLNADRFREWIKQELQQKGG